MQRIPSRNIALSFDVAAFRENIRQFLRDTIADLSPQLRARSWSAFDSEFSGKLGAKGWIGMVWPARCGGANKTALERYILFEELLAAGAPVGAHWIADRQSGSQILRFAEKHIAEKYLPAIARGELFFCIGMSEPNAGSDLAAIKTKAEKVPGGWKINGAKIWSTNAHQAHFMITLVRTSPPDAQHRHKGMSQFLVDLSLPGVTIKPIQDQTGAEHFAEVFFDDVIVPNDCLIGKEGEGWAQVNSELTLERSGPERFLSSFILLQTLVAELEGRSSVSQSIVSLIGECASELWTLRQMSMCVASKLTDGEEPFLDGAIVKDLGARFEQDLPYKIQSVIEDDDELSASEPLTESLDYLLAAAPAFSLRGGTKEILRGIIARELGLR